MARWGELCYARAHGDCRGRIQAAHWISVQILKSRQAAKRVAIRNGRVVDEPAHYLVDMPLSGLIADPRNGVPLCVHHHDSFDRRNGQSLDPIPPREVIEFANEFGLDDLLIFPKESVRW